jgi:hypothetical protein
LDTCIRNRFYLSIVLNKGAMIRKPIGNWQFAIGK